MRCQGRRAECSTLKPTRYLPGGSLVSVEGCRGKVAVCKRVNMLSPDIFAGRGAIVFSALDVSITGRLPIPNKYRTKEAFSDIYTYGRDSEPPKKRMFRRY